MTQTADELQTKMTNRAKALVEAMAKQDYQTGIMHFDSTMSTVMTAAKLEETWTTILSRVGAFKGVGGVRHDTSKEHPSVAVLAQFEKATIDVVVTFDANASIAGIHLAPDEKVAAAFHEAAPEKA